MPRQWLQRGPMFAERQPRSKPDPPPEEQEPILFESYGWMALDWVYREGGKLVLTPTRLIWKPEHNKPLAVRLASVSKYERKGFPPQFPLPVAIRVGDHRLSFVVGGWHSAATTDHLFEVLSGLIPPQQNASGQLPDLPLVRLRMNALPVLFIWTIAMAGFVAIANPPSIFSAVGVLFCAPGAYLLCRTGYLLVKDRPRQEPEL